MSSSTSPSEPVVIPTKSFYSTARNQPKSLFVNTRETRKTQISQDSPKATKPNAHHRSTINGSNKNVNHKIRRRNNQLNPIEIDSILCNIRNEKLRDRIQSKRLEKQQVKRIYDSLRTSVNPGRPLSALNLSNTDHVDENETDDQTTADFSDFDSFSEDETTENNNNNNNNNQCTDYSNKNDVNLVDISDSEVRPETPHKERKFFKSRQTSSIPKQIQVTDNIKALICNGKMKIVAVKRNAPKRIKTTIDCSVEINNILKNLDADHCEKERADTIKSHKGNDERIKQVRENRILNNSTPMETTDDAIRTPLDRVEPFNEVQTPLDRVEPLNEVQNVNENLNFQTLIPVNKDDAVSMEYEETDEGLESLISSSSDIIIIDDDVNVESTHKEQASNFNINEDTNHTNHTEKMDNNVSALSSQKLFPLFYPGQCQPLKTQSTRRIRVWNGGFGLNQFQIDAGQKEFGIKQCKQCGLTYGVHEPEEEKLHHDFHSSLHVLRFKGWIDEDRVADYNQWGRDGRIIRITDSADHKRRKRLEDILQIVDRELGFSSYIIPQTFVSFFAVRNGLIIGFCLVQPLNKANKYVCNNGIDCCTVEEFEAKCGISRIWVSPLCRRMHIGQKLLQAVQMNTILGEEIPLSKIAFSSPTEDGRRFAQKVTGTEDFLVYQ